MRRQVLCAVACAVVLLGACGHDGEEQQQVHFGSFAQEPPDLLDIARLLDWSVDERGCLRAETSTEPGAVPVLLPQGTTRDGETLTAPGKPPVSYSGGTSSGAVRAPLTRLANLGPSLPESCAGAAEVWLVYSIGKARRDPS